MQRFFVIEDYTVCTVWDRLILEEMLGLPSKPVGWGRTENTLPEGNWTLGHGIHQMATDGAYEKAGIPKPSFEQLPAMFCVDDDGIVGQYRVTTAPRAVEFIRKHLKG